MTTPQSDPADAASAALFARRVLTRLPRSRRLGQFASGALLLGSAVVAAAIVVLTSGWTALHDVRTALRPLVPTSRAGLAAVGAVLILTGILVAGVLEDQ